MESVFKKVDRLICRYLGIDKTELIPHSVNKKGNRILILNSESYKRHIHQTPFSEIDVSTINNENKKKLGIAIGKAIAKNLTISFDNVILKKEKKDEG